jgi:uncharacterized protein (TIGR02246 family)
MKLLLTYILLSIGFCFNIQAQNQDDIAIKKIVKEYEALFSQRDSKAIATIWSEDGDFITHLGDLLHGRQEIEKYHQNIFTQFYQGAQNKLSDPSIRYLKSDVAAVDVRWEMMNATTADGRPRSAFKGL